MIGKLILCVVCLALLALMFASWPAAAIGLVVLIWLKW